VHDAIGCPKDYTYMRMPELTRAEAALARLRADIEAKIVGEDRFAHYLALLKGEEPQQPTTPRHALCKKRVQDVALCAKWLKVVDERLDKARADLEEMETLRAEWRGADAVARAALLGDDVFQEELVPKFASVEAAMKAAEKC
jgi:hypothetical protein